jgi:hypothetical protein
MIFSFADIYKQQLCRKTRHTASIIRMMEAVRTSETSVDNHFTWQYIPEDNSEHHTRCRENLKSHKDIRGFVTLQSATDINSSMSKSTCTLHLKIRRHKHHAQVALWWAADKAALGGGW